MNSSAIEMSRLRLRKDELARGFVNLREMLVYNLPKMRGSHELERMTSLSAIAGTTYNNYLKIVETFNQVANLIDLHPEDNRGWLLDQMTLRTERRCPVITDGTARAIRLVYEYADSLEGVTASRLEAKSVAAGAQDCLLALEMLIADLDVFCE